MADAKLAVDTGVDGVDVVIGTSSFLREHSHGKDMAYITKSAIEVINYIKRHAFQFYASHNTLMNNKKNANSFSAEDGKSAFLPRTLSDPILSTFSPCTRLSTQLVLTVSASPIRSVALAHVRFTISSALYAVLSHVISRLTFTTIQVFYSKMHHPAILSSSPTWTNSPLSGCAIANAHAALEAGATRE